MVIIMIITPATEYALLIDGIRSGFLWIGCIGEASLCRNKLIGLNGNLYCSMSQILIEYSLLQQQLDMSHTFVSGSFKFLQCDAGLHVSLIEFLSTGPNVPAGGEIL